MVGTQMLRSEDVVVYYFEKSSGEVYDLEINSDGSFMRDFGPGFMDESAKLQFELLRAKKRK